MRSRINTSFPKGIRGGIKEGRIRFSAVHKETQMNTKVHKKQNGIHRAQGTQNGKKINKKNVT